ncbi:hypothetical protein [Ralstonia syzygii]|uniref:Type III effector protein n=1 Tax=Ralstonia syzygii R24 TaxID=907261 RepID=G3A2X4_9RALS|nr:hypothetical protein [Ralstonia syzygii]CCA85795.1 conserved hypothetical protein [Ralstonia syzygii R24]
MDFAMGSPAPSDHYAEGRSARQASGHLSHLSDLSRSRNRLAVSEAQAAVTDVLNFVRDTYYRHNLKSGNKVYGNGGPKEVARQERATLEVERMRLQYEPLAAAMQGKAHQCQELALLAMHHLQERGLPAQILELGGDDETVTHDVAIIGPASNPLPADMKEWHPNVYVCDPWSNIACRARDYPDQFTRKMEKWEGAGKLVGFQAKGFVLPTDSDWLRDVLHGQKRV